MQGKLTNIFKVTPENIWNYKQNHPELVIKDLDNYHVSHDIQFLVRQSMLVRGINKWLKVRRDLIAYKKLIKHEIKNLINEIPKLKRELKDNYVSIIQVKNGEKSLQDFVKYENIVNLYLRKKDKLKILERIRSDLKAFCMTERWQIWKGKQLKDMNTLRKSD